MRPTWAVMLVHGVGDTDPGATLSAFLPKALNGRALKESAPPQTRLLVEPAPRLPPEHPLPPPAAADETPIALADRFPMHLRTFEIAGADGGKPGQAVFAEVFWADLSRAGQSRWEVLRRTISLVFDLRHISNVAAAYRGLRLASGLRLILHFISWLLCGPIAGLTAFTLALLVARYSIRELATGVRLG